MIPSAEAIETVGVTTSNYDAEFGRAGGAVTNVTLKSGTNDLQRLSVHVRQHRGHHGAEPIHARCRRLTPHTCRRGFTLGGPIKRNKLFFFGDYVRAQRRQRPYHASPRARGGVPQRRLQLSADDHLRSGDRRCRRRRANSVPEQSDPCQSHQSLSRCGCSTRSRCRTFPARRLGANQLSRSPYVREKRTNQFDVKITYQAAAERQPVGSLQPSECQDEGPGNVRHLGRREGLFAESGTNPTYNMAINYNRVWSASLVQEVRVGRTSHHNVAITEAHGMNLADEIGVPGANLNAFTSGLAHDQHQPATMNFLIGFETLAALGSRGARLDVRRRARRNSGEITPFKVGGDVRISRHMLDQVTHPRGEFELPARHDGKLERTALRRTVSPMRIAALHARCAVFASSEAWSTSPTCCTA